MRRRAWQSRGKWLALALCLGLGLTFWLTGVTRAQEPLPPTPVAVTFPLDNADFRAALCITDAAYTLSEGQMVAPILLYHLIGRTQMERGGRSTSRFNVTAADFEAQLALLQRLGYHTVTVAEIAAAIRGQFTLPERPIALTVDDAWTEQYTVMFPLLQKYGMRATFYVPSTYLNGGRMMSWEQVKALHAAGMEIGSHTRRHARLTAVGALQAWREISTSRLELEAQLGAPVVSLAYPYGSRSAGVMSQTEKAGYAAGAALGVSPIQGPQNLYALNRIEIYGTQSLLQFVRRLPWRGRGGDLCQPLALPATETGE